MTRYIPDDYLYKSIGADIHGRCGRCKHNNIDCLKPVLSRGSICGTLIKPPALLKIGKWIDAKPGSGKFGKVCSCCGNEAYWDSDYGQQLFGWCPWCGAEMKGKGDAEIDLCE